MKTHVEHLVAHMTWADARTLDALRRTEVAEAVRLFAHVVTAEQLYLERIRGEDPWPQDFWPVLSLEACAARSTKNHEHYGALVRTLDEEALGRPVRYRNSTGTVYHTAIGEMLTHLALHGAHHRGQIARLVRAAGGEPAVTDYITYTRERA